jgi:hypothetical protein
LCATIKNRKATMSKIIIILIITGFSQLTFGQSCIHTDLSQQFDIGTSLIRIKDDSCIVTVRIIDKSSKKTLQTIKYSSIYLFENVLKNCENVRSYQTRKNDSLEVVDNDFGDLIVADFNFDGKDDIAIIKDSGGNGGPLYRYYIQNTDFKFVRDKFLSDKMEFFPIQINKNDSTLITHVHAGVCSLSEMIYSYNSQTNNWIRKSHRIIDICKK